MRKKVFLVISFVILLLVVVFIVIFKIRKGGYKRASEVEKSYAIEISLNGDERVVLEYGLTFDDPGVIAKYGDLDITEQVVVDDSVDYEKVGSYIITYSVEHKGKHEQIARTVDIEDTVNPIVNLNGNEDISFYLGTKYKDPGYSAYDNYDGDLTSEVLISNLPNSEVAGTYEVLYSVTDSSGNVGTITRKVKYVPRPQPRELPDVNGVASAIAVLNYHFFCDPNLGESCSGSNFITVQSFEEQLQFLRDNGYKTLSMDEFVRWMYGEISLPSRSVLLTVDDGAAGTGFHNGNKLIPLLEKYQAHATLFLITGWWNIENYKSDYLDVESHSNDMHTEKYCEGVSRGAKMLCLSPDEVLADLQKSIEITGSNNAFCYPFYASSALSNELVQQAGFKLAFVGGERKATVGSFKYSVPRYHIYKSTTLDAFRNMIS